MKCEGFSRRRDKAEYTDDVFYEFIFFMQLVDLWKLVDLYLCLVADL